MARILVVDDRALNRDLLRSLLGHFGHHVSEAADGLEALEALGREAFDLVISDIVMPGMDGAEMVRRMRLQPSLAKVPVIFYTATYRAPEARAIAAENGVKWVLPKPCEPSEMLRIVHEALGQPPPLAAGSGSTAASRAPADTLERMHSLGLRMAMMVELGVELVTERDPGRLLDFFCRAFQDLLNARYSGVAIVDDEGRVQRFASRGLAPTSSEGLAAALESSPLVGRLRLEGRVLRADCTAGAHPQGLLPPPHPPVSSLLLAPLALPGRFFGWLYAADRFNDSPFPSEDERIAQTVANQLSVAWANLVHDQEQQLHAARLQHEIAQRRRAEDEVLLLNAQLESRVARRTADLAEAVREMESLSYSVSHELRAPLRSMDGFSLLLLEEYAGRLDDEGRDALSRIRAASQRMGAMIDDMQRLSRVGRAAMRRESLDLSAVAREVAASVDAERSGHGVRWQIEACLAIHADPALIRVVMRNLMENAWKFSSRADPALVRVGAREREGTTVYFVSDDGVGFEMAQAGQLFAAFQRLHPDAEFAGTGTGLVIARRIVNRHGGRIWAESRPGEGATFFFTVGEAAPSEARAPPEPIATAGLP